jgi:diaminopimelate dehydrogenase
MIKIGIVGFGNIARGVQLSIQQNPDMELVAVFTRRPPQTIKGAMAEVYHMNDIPRFKGKIDVMMLCGGSAKDLPEQTPQIARMFCTVDSFDTHADIPEYFAKVDEAARKGRKLSIISVGWDPGLFSINRAYARAILPQGVDYTFWGDGVSQGHSDAVRRIDGVKAAVQYTLPAKEALEKIRSGQTPELSTREKHSRLCYVVAHEGADRARIEGEIVNMPKYFADYDTTVKFVDMDEFEREHSRMNHGGFVLRSGITGEGSRQIIEYGLKLDSNPEFTASVLTAYARAAYRMANDGETGARTVLDVAPGLLSAQTPEELRAELL